MKNLNRILTGMDVANHIRTRKEELNRQRNLKQLEINKILNRPRK